MSPDRAATVGVVLAGTQLAVAATFAVLATIVWEQGLPQGYDTVETMSIEAQLVARIAVFGALPLFAAFVASIVLVSRGPAGSRVRPVLATIMLFASAVFSGIGYRVWAGFGW